MIKKIKDLTKEELKKYLNSHDYVRSYKDYEKLVESIFMLKDRYFWGQPMLSDEFLNTIVYIPEPHILDKQEHDYLRAVCKPFKIMSIEKKDYKAYQQIEFFYNKSGKSYSTFSLPPFKKGSMYKGMKPFKQYSIAYLELDKEWEE